MPMLSAGCGP
ncbi:unnamed protein product [Cuscuta epithymum]|uniref:Uncharacterized protein n=1 Tax=Cuscuta epithymum TaxID=186058 RepID=A0AAV0G157_9ASTE|nr:unnamed protein product [Cuscuta epithymum]